jgi:transposase InsO family protein
LSSKEEVINYLFEFINRIEMQYNDKLKIVKSNNGTEFINNKFISFYKEKEIIHQTSYTYTTQQNDAVEKKIDIYLK